MYDFREGSSKKKDSPKIYDFALSILTLSVAQNIDMIAGALEAILGNRTTLEMNTMHTKQEENETRKQERPLITLLRNRAHHGLPAAKNLLRERMAFYFIGCDLVSVLAVCDNLLDPDR